jgi:hypothetical protein
MSADILHFPWYGGNARLPAVVYTIRHRSPIMPPWWAFWREPVAQFELVGPFITIGPLTREELREAVVMVRMTGGAVQ